MVKASFEHASTTTNHDFFTKKINKIIQIIIFVYSTTTNRSFFIEKIGKKKMKL